MLVYNYTDILHKLCVQILQVHKYMYVLVITVFSVQLTVKKVLSLLQKVFLKCCLIVKVVSE